MFGSNVLEIAIGMIFVYLLFSLFLTSIREAIEGRLKTRSADLERGLRVLLADDAGTGLVKALYRHPLISGLYVGDYTPGRFSAWTGARRGGANLPSYIPPRNFALAIMDIMAGQGTPTGQPLGREFVAESLAAAREAPGVARIIQLSLRLGKGDLNKLEGDLEAWFNGAMERVSGWYKRRTQTILFWLGLILAVLLNVNTLTLGQTLARNSTLRAVVVAQAGRLAATDTAPAVKAGPFHDEVESLGLPIGWGPAAFKVIRERFTCEKELPCALTVATGGFELVVGWALTAFAASLGAPFWFDTLKKVMVVRSTIKPAPPGPPVAPVSSDAPDMSDDAVAPAAESFAPSIASIDILLSNLDPTTRPREP